MSLASAAAPFEFDTGRLSIRVLSAHDEPLYRELYTDPETMRYIGQPLTQARVARSFRAAVTAAHRQSGEYPYLALFERAAGQPIGIGSVRQLDTQRRRVEAGIMIRTAARTHGYAKEGLAALVARAFEILPIDEVWVEVAADHAVVERLVVSVGFSPGDERPGWRIWLAQRQSWHPPAPLARYERCLKSESP